MEGVIQFQLDFHHAGAVTAADIRELNAWRQVMLQLGMIGQTPERYANLGFGNISQRCESQAGFVISGTQTGGLGWLDSGDCALVTACHPAENRLSATGLTKPSSEAMTHGQLYQMDPDIRFVIHAHCPVIWQGAATLGLHRTQMEVPYGSVAMAFEVERIFTEKSLRQAGVFVMGGHEDGIVAFGRSGEQAAWRLIRCYVAALQLR